MSSKDIFFDKRVLVTGANGFIGGKLCIKLKELGAEIYGISRSGPKESEEIDRWITGDLVNYDFIKSTINSIKPDTIFHLAGYVSGKRELEAVLPSYHNNLTSTINILTASTEFDIQRLVLSGSLEEPKSGDEEIVPVSPYAASKWAGTLYAKMFYKLYGTPVTIPRIFMVYGPGKQDFEKLVPYVVQTLHKKNSPNLTSGSRLVDWIYIDDIVEGLIRMAIEEGVEGRAIDLGSGRQFSVKEVAQKIKTIIGGNTEINFGKKPDRDFERIRKADLDTTQKLIDWEPQIDIDEGLRRTVKWFENINQ